MAVHAEEDDIVTYMEAKLRREGNDQGYNLHLAHNNISEDIAFRKIVRLAKHTEAGIYFVHTTAKEGVAAITEARNQQLPVYGETLHNYLEFTCEDYKKPGGTAIHTYPAIKFADDRDALQQGLVEGTLCTTATDEYTTYKDVKLSGNTIDTVCGGHNGIETRLPVTYTKLVASGRISLERFAEITSTNAAKILGMYPKKGTIAVGSDADLVVFDPSLRKKLALGDLHADSDYYILEGFECQGWGRIIGVTTSMDTMWRKGCLPGNRLLLEPRFRFFVRQVVGYLGQLSGGTLQGYLDFFSAIFTPVRLGLLQ